MIAVFLKCCEHLALKGVKAKEGKNKLCLRGMPLATKQHKRLQKFWIFQYGWSACMLLTVHAPRTEATGLLFPWLRFNIKTR